MLCRGDEMDIKEVITNFVISINELELDKKKLIDEIRQTEDYKNTSPKVKNIIDKIYDNVLLAP